MALELLRPFVETNSWDYCIVWQFGDDPSRYIKWTGCCCIGSSKGVCINVKEEIDDDDEDEDHHFSQLCRDTYLKHSLYTNACHKLAMVPLYLPLYSGIHGEVAMSAQPSWNHDSVGTQVLIPVNGGLIELYRSKQVPKDEEMIETIMTQFNIFPQQIMVDLKTDQVLLNGSNPWSENSSLVSVGSTQVSPTQSIDNKPKTRQENGQKEYHSKNLIAERSRRNRIKDGMFTLRSIVPKISKMDRISILGDAAEYIKELQTDIQRFEEEIKRLDNDDSESHVEEIEVCKPKRSYQQMSTSKVCNRRSTSSCRKPEVEVEVHQIGVKDFLLKVTCDQKPRGFQRLMEIANSLGLQVVDVNVTTCYGRVLNTLKVEAKGKVVAAKSLREVLLHSWTSSIFQANPTRSG